MPEIMNCLCSVLMAKVFYEYLGGRVFSGKRHLRLKVVCRSWYYEMLNQPLCLKFRGEEVVHQLELGNKTLPKIMVRQKLHKVQFMWGISNEAAELLVQMMASRTSDVESVMFMGWPLQFIKKFSANPMSLQGITEFMCSCSHFWLH